MSVDHNQLINTKGLRDVYTLLHLDCSHNHLVSVEGLENSALLNTLDLTANSLAEVKTATADQKKAHNLMSLVNVAIFGDLYRSCFGCLRGSMS